MTQDAARQRAIEALAEAMRLSTWDVGQTGPKRAGLVFDYLDAHPEAKAALQEWLFKDWWTSGDQRYAPATPPPPEPDEPPLSRLVAAARDGGTVMLARYEGRSPDMAWEAVTEPDESGLCVGSGATPEDAVRDALGKIGAG